MTSGRDCSVPGVGDTEKVEFRKSNSTLTPTCSITIVSSPLSFWLVRVSPVQPSPGRGEEWVWWQGRGETGRGEQ